LLPLSQSEVSREKSFKAMLRPCVKNVDNPTINNQNMFQATGSFVKYGLHNDIENINAQKLMHVLTKTHLKGRKYGVNSKYRHVSSSMIQDKTFWS
jgi:hypothetical protein